MLDGPVDHVRGVVALARAGDDDDVGSLLEELAPVVEVVRVADDLEGRLALEGLLDEPRIGVLGEGDEDANRVGHVSVPSRCRR